MYVFALYDLPLIIHAASDNRKSLARDQCQQKHPQLPHVILTHMNRANPQLQRALGDQST
jgi:hypothetical protein